MTNKKAKIDAWLIIIGILILLIVLGFILPKGTIDKNFIEVRLYDSKGNLITTTESFSIVNGVPGVASIDLSINVRNTGGIALSCDLTSISPPQFNSAVIKSTKTVEAGNSVGWTSSKINVAQFEVLTQPVRFSATVTCNSGVITLTPKIGYIDLTITPDAQGNFDVTLSQGGLPTEFCGDGTCQTGETATSCPTDCAITSNAKFRTTDLSYVAGSAVGYSDTCGNILTAYGYVEESTVSQACATKMPSDSYCGSSGNIPLGILPGGWITGGANPTLWRSATSPGKLCICDDSGSGTNVVKIYRTSDSDASKINTQARSIDSAKEVAC